MISPPAEKESDAWVAQRVTSNLISLPRVGSLFFYAEGMWLVPLSGLIAATNSLAGWRFDSATLRSNLSKTRKSKRSSRTAQ